MFHSSSRPSKAEKSSSTGIMADKVTIRQKRNIVILGRTGVGKKSIANQILDQQYFHIGSSMEGATRNAYSKHVELPDERRLVLYKIKIIDTVGPYSSVIDKKTIFNQIRDYFRSQVPEGVNLIIFSLRKDMYNIEEETKVLNAILKDFKDDIRKTSALVVTGCEGLNEEGRQRVIQDIRTDPNTRNIAQFMEKGIHPVGFPLLHNMLPILKEAIKEGIASDAERLRQVVLASGEKILPQDILRQKWLHANAEQSGSPFNPEKLWQDCKIL